MRNKIAFAVGFFLVVSPLISSAQTVSLGDTCSSNPTIQCLQQEIQLLVQILNQLLAARTTHSTQATASIDQSSLTTSSGVPTITGSASGVSSVYVAVTAGTNQAGTANQAGNGQVSVVNGRWNVTIYPKAEDVFTAGVYSVSVYTALGGTLLTTGTLSILGNALQPTATIDQSSQSKTAGALTISGTGSGSVIYDGVTVFLAPLSASSYSNSYATVAGQLGKDGFYQNSSAGIKDNGPWTAGFSYVNAGSYLILVY